MNQTSTQTEFYKQRDFGQKISDTFSFLLGNFKELFLMYAKTILPAVALLSVIPAFMQKHFLYGTGNPNFVLEDYTPIFITILYFLSYILITLYGQSMINTYLYKKMIIDKQPDPELFDFKKAINKNFLRIIVLALLIMLIMLICFGIPMFIVIAIFSISPFLMIPFFFIGMIPGIIVMVMLSYSQAICVFENVGAIDSISKCFKFGFTKWWSTLGLIFVVGLISGLIGLIISIPNTVVQSVQLLVFGGSRPFYLDVISYFTQILYVFGAILLSTLSATAIAFQYANIREIKEGISLEKQISEFDKQ